MILEALLELREPDIIDSDDGLSPDEGRQCLLLEMRVAEICQVANLSTGIKKHPTGHAHIKATGSILLLYRILL
jgi:hypothetical protein